MALKIRMSRGGAKKRPHYRIVVADSRSPRDGRFIEKLGLYDPMLAADHENRVVLNEERIKYWLGQGAKPSDRVARFFGDAGIIAKPGFREQPVKSKPKAKAQERLKAAAEAAAAPAKTPPPAPAAEVAAVAEPAEEVAPEAAAEAPAEPAPEPTPEPEPEPAPEPEKAAETTGEDVAAAAAGDDAKAGGDAAGDSKEGPGDEDKASS